MALIDVEGLHFAYGATVVLEDLDLQIRAGELVAMLGPNGAGKTTLVENLLGTLVPDRGTVRVCGINPRRAGARFWPKVGFMSQHWSDHSKWRVMEQLEWIRACYDTQGGPTRDPAQILDALELSDKAQAPLGKLSGGQRRRVDFAAALLSRPELLILDEPTTGLDPVAKAKIHDLVADCQDGGTTVLLTTHDLAEAEKISSRIVILAGGGFLADGTAHELRRRLARESEITWREAEETFVHSTSEVESFVARLDLSTIRDLTITRPSLEDAYLELVSQAEGAQVEPPSPELRRATEVDAEGRAVRGRSASDEDVSASERSAR
ncbi:MAG: ABC transporter ATP-binding protein [Bowdeniella nasicola]|nr:ABC transporter ATP-binding protein [Bowdeniella nasicola]